MGKFLAVTFVTVQFVLIFEVGAIPPSETLGYSVESGSALPEDAVLYLWDDIIQNAPPPRLINERIALQNELADAAIGRERTLKDVLSTGGTFNLANRLNLVEGSSVREPDAVISQNSPLTQLPAQLRSSQPAIPYIDVSKESVLPSAPWKSYDSDPMNQSEIQWQQRATENPVLLGVPGS